MGLGFGIQKIMSLAILQAISDKKADFPAVNKLAIERQVPFILQNYSEIKGRNYNRSTIYRQVGRDDYHQPSFIESLFDYWAALSFRSEQRGEIIVGEVESWRDWRIGIAEPLTVFDFWFVEEQIDTLLSRVRQCHVAEDTAGQRESLLKIRERVNWMLRMTAATEGK